MKKMNKKKRYITLVEMMIVMFLIAMITGVIAYNYTGSLEEGKAFKTKSGIDKIRTILDLYQTSHSISASEIENNWKGIVAISPIAKNAAELTKDGWGVDYEVNVDQEGNILITSQKYQEYQRKKGAGSLFNENQS